MRFVAASLTAVGLTCALPICASATRAHSQPLFAVGYGSERDLAHAVAGRADVVRRLTQLRVAEVRPHDDGGFVATARRAPGIRYVQRVAVRAPFAEPALFETT